MKEKVNGATLNSGIFKHAELEAILGSRMAVKRALAAGFIEKISRGFYKTPDIPNNQAFFAVIKKFYPGAVISKRTLLYHYKLTTDQPSEIDIDVTHDSKLRNSTDLVSVHRTNKIFSTHTAEFNSIKLKCYTVERALFEVLTFEGNFGILTSEVVHKYLANHKYESARIHKIATHFGFRGLQLANLIQVMAGDKHRVTRAS
jgi:predicted transcriptional regulator of viral defense system